MQVAQRAQVGAWPSARSGIGRVNQRAVTASANRRDVLLGSGLILGTSWAGPGLASPSSIYDFSALQYEQEVPLSKYKGQNVNYPGLRTLYNTYHDDGFNVIAFPCNQFGGQAPGTSEEERQWAFRKFGFEFDVFDKLEVNGPGAHPLYQFLRQQQPASAPGQARQVPGAGGPGAIEWNYVKFLVNREGQAVARYKPGFDPLEFEADVRLALAGKPPLNPECLMHPGRKGCKVERLLQQA
ncbi:hypothetical protein OEZ85_003295 [Tetradesmus obliquus]|uniref:Glutathione peroxidase n=1 Tax=Tetradesmus obliquus TaxID=3088 RepID=A0ABY8U2G0_TETOB|nr:hypothetical protein OEZ85_003295 [Tetradesmus obliquus]